jgi:hypothetical protein
LAVAGKVCREEGGCAGCIYAGFEQPEAKGQQLKANEFQEKTE